MTCKIPLEAGPSWMVHPKYVCRWWPSLFFEVDCTTFLATGFSHSNPYRLCLAGFPNALASGTSLPSSLAPSLAIHLCFSCNELLSLPWKCYAYIWLHIYNRCSPSPERLPPLLSQKAPINPLLRPSLYVISSGSLFLTTLSRIGVTLSSVLVKHSVNIFIAELFVLDFNDLL